MASACEPPGGGIQEGEVLHHGERGRGQPLDARAGDATTAFWLHFPETFLARFQDLSPTEKQTAELDWATCCGPWPRSC